MGRRKGFFDPIEGRKESGDLRVAIVRVEQFYPFPLRSVRELLAKYASASEFVWAQEEPRNMGGWTFMRERLEKLLDDPGKLSYVGRDASASPATGSYSVHQKEQAGIVATALKIQ